MGIALTKLKGFIQTYLSHGNGHLLEEVSEEIRLFIQETFVSLQWQTEEEVWNMPEESRICYIGDLQSQLTELMNDLNSGEALNSTAAGIAEIARELLQKTCRFLDYLRQSFGLYFNFSAALPHYFIVKHQRSTNNEPEGLLRSLQVAGIDHQLYEVLESYIKVFVAPDRLRISSWGQLQYLEQTATWLDDFCKGPLGENVTLELLKVLVGHDFNSIHINKYFTKYIERITTSDLSGQEQQDELLYLLKVFRQVRIEVKSSFDPGVQPLKESVSDSLLAELDYLAKKEKVFIKSFAGPEGAKPTRFYFEVMFTLAELMFFLRIMMEAGILQTKFNSHVYEFVSAHIRTKRSENLSKKSMRNHFNNKPFPDRIVQKVREYLSKMITYIDQHYKDQP